jgi:hypothetical protein
MLPMVYESSEYSFRNTKVALFLEMVAVWKKPWGDISQLWIEELHLLSLSSFSSR